MDYLSCLVITAVTIFVASLLQLRLTSLFNYPAPLRVLAWSRENSMRFAVVWCILDTACVSACIALSVFAVKVALTASAQMYGELAWGLMRFWYMVVNVRIIRDIANANASTLMINGRVGSSRE